jgi:ABC-type Fe3+-hydroxamate transport system substrate-binding protein
MRSHVISSRLCVVLLLSLVVLLAACGQSGSSASSTPTQTPVPTVTLDAYGKPITFPTTAPQHIVSLTPNISEMLGALHLEGRVVAVDYYTNYPADLASLPKVSNANQQYNVEQIVALHPDLVLSYGQDTKAYDSQLTNLGLHIVDLPTGNLDLTLKEILTVGRLTFTLNAATTLYNQLQQQVSQVKSKVAGTTAPKVMIEADDTTQDKPYIFGGGTFDDELVQDANGINIFHDNTTNGGFPQVSVESIISAHPQYIILTEDPAYGGNVNAVYKRANWSSIDALKMHQVYRINPNVIGRPGPRLVEGLQCLAQILHPDKFPGALPDYCTGTM